VSANVPVLYAVLVCILRLMVCLRKAVRANFDRSREGKSIMIYGDGRKKENKNNLKLQQ